MDSLNDLTLQGYFQSLKDEVNKQFKQKEHARLLHLLQKAVGLIEEVYEKDFQLLHPDNSIDYKEMIETLNDYGVSYTGKKEILEMANDRVNPTIEKPVQAKPEKLPMKRAEGKKGEQQGDQQRRKLG